MHELNHDIEDLFRRATESYPLKPGSNWDTINSQLNAVSPETSKQVKNKKRRFIFLLLFLFLAAGTYISIALLSPNSKNVNKNYNIVTGDNNNTLTQKADNPLTTKEQNNPGEIKQNQSDYTTQTQIDEKETFFRKANNNHKIHYNKWDVIDNKNVDRLTLNENNVLNQEFIPNNRESRQFIEHPVLLSFSGLSNVNHPIIANEIKLPSPMGKLAAALTPLSQTQSKKPPAFYLGITAGPAINSVKSYGRRWAVKGGLFAGWLFNSKFSGETGLIFTKNYYEAKSDHFDEKEIAGMLTGGRQLYEVHGSNQMLEIPLSIRYKFSPRTKSIYVGAGLTSHILTRESNWYLTTINGTNEMLYGNYDNKKLYFASAIKISTGFQAPLGKKTSLRVEPYTQLPLKGIGIGKIKLMSTGFNISLSRTTQ